MAHSTCILMTDQNGSTIYPSSVWEGLVHGPWVRSNVCRAEERGKAQVPLPRFQLCPNSGPLINRGYRGLETSTNMLANAFINQPISMPMPLMSWHIFPSVLHCFEASSPEYVCSEGLLRDGHEESLVLLTTALGSVRGSTSARFQDGTDLLKATCSIS